MPFKSAAQRRKFAELLVAGKISADTFEEWNRETGSKKLPDHVTRRKPARAAPKSKKSNKKTTTKKRSTKKKSTTTKTAPARPRKTKRR